MSKQTLLFPSFEELSAFSKTLSIGYLINFNRLTITASFDAFQIQRAVERFGAKLVETRESTHALDPS